MYPCFNRSLHCVLLLWMLMLTRQSSYLYVLVTHSVIHVDKISTKIITLKKLSPMSRIKLGSITTTSRSRGTFGVSKRLEKLKRRRYTHKGGIQLRQLELAVRRNRGPDGFPGWGTVVLPPPSLLSFACCFSSPPGRPAVLLDYNYHVVWRRTYPPHDVFLLLSVRRSFLPIPQD